MLRSFRRLAVLSLALAMPPAVARTFEGTVTHVTDGDSVWVQPARGGEPVEVRLQGVDAPEICQEHGPRSREALASRLLKHRVTVTTRATDDYGRTLARLRHGGRDIGAWLVEAGHAWSMRHRGRAGPYAQEEARARAARIGLWRHASPEPPRTFRQRHGSCHP